MRNATLAIEALQVTSPSRSFWYTASGFFDAVAGDPSDEGTLAQANAARTGLSTAIADVIAAFQERQR